MEEVLLLNCPDIIESLTLLSKCLAGPVRSLPGAAGELEVHRPLPLESVLGAVTEARPPTVWELGLWSWKD